MGFQPPALMLEQSTRPKRAKWKTVGIPVLVGLVGMMLGSATAASGAKSEIDELRLLGETLTLKVASLTETNQELVGAAKTVEEERAAGAKVLAEQKRLATESQDQVTKLHEQVKQLEAEIQSARASAAEADAQAEANAVASAPAPFAAAPPSQPAPSSAYYENCTAARNAGAAPVYAGDPGYGRHLDRDGDGVGCE